MSHPKFRRAALRASAAMLAASGISIQAAQADDAAMASEPPVSVLDVIVVSAHPDPHTRFDLLQSTSVLTGEDLVFQLEGTIGETLSGLPGITSTFFGPGASRPIIRGLSGDRIRVLVNGIGTIDASTTSADHAVAAEPLTAQTIEVVRGPANLMYGNNAVGGIVNLIDDRIPQAVPENGFSGQVTALYGTNADERGVGADVNAALTGDEKSGLVLHLSGFYRKSNDYKIPGFAMLDDDHDHDDHGHDDDDDHGHNDDHDDHHDDHGHDDHHDDHGHDDDHDHEDENTFGFVANSDTETRGLNAGLSYVWDRGHFGMAYSRFDSNYGIPPGGHVHGEGHDHDHGHDDDHDHHDDHGHDDDDHGHDHGEEEEEIVRIDMVQDRFDLAGEVRGDWGPFQTARIRFGYADYRHVELENGEEGTVFSNEGWEGRLELVQQPLANMDLIGSWGLQLRDRDFSAIGEEAFIPPSDLFSWGLFTFQELTVNDLTLDLGLRFERQETDAIGIERNFNMFSVSGGLGWTFDNNWLVGVTIGRSERAPTPEELFADGAHLAIGAFEIGDPDLLKEKAVNLEAFIRKRGGPFTGSISGFVTWYDDYIAQVFNGEMEEGLPVLLQIQTDARFIGFEIELGWQAINANGFTLDFDAHADYVRATDTTNDVPLPRIPPFRFLIGAEATYDRFSGRLEVQHVTRQNRVAPEETPTDGYTFLNASIAFKPFRDRPDMTLMIRGKNLTNAKARANTSFLKDNAPLPGRDVRFSLNMTF